MQKLDAQPTVCEVKVIVLSQPYGNAACVEPVSYRPVRETSVQLEPLLVVRYRRRVDDPSAAPMTEHQPWRSSTKWSWQPVGTCASRCQERPLSVVR